MISSTVTQKPNENSMKIATYILTANINTTAKSEIKSCFVCPMNERMFKMKMSMTVIYHINRYRRKTMTISTEAEKALNAILICY